MIVVMSIEDTLATGIDLKTAQPTKWAKAIYDGLRSQHNVVGLTQASHEIARWWTKREHLDNWARIVNRPDYSPLSWPEWRVDFIRATLAEGWEIFAYVDTDPFVLADVRGLGVATIGVSYPTITPGWKEVAPPRAWAEVASTVDERS